MALVAGFPKLVVLRCDTELYRADRFATDRLIEIFRKTNTPRFLSPNEIRSIGTIIIVLGTTGPYQWRIKRLLASSHSSTFAE